jgi:hypothetical protein
MKHVVADTGPLVAFLNSRDAHHDWAVGVLGGVEPPLLTCEAVISEACFFVRQIDGGPDAFLTLDDDFRVYRRHGRETVPAILPRLTEPEARSKNGDRSSEPSRRPRDRSAHRAWPLRRARRSSSAFARLGRVAAPTTAPAAPNVEQPDRVSQPWRSTHEPADRGRDGAVDAVGEAEALEPNCTADELHRFDGRIVLDSCGRSRTT